MTNSTTASLLLIVIAFSTQLAGVSRDEPVKNPTDIPLSWSGDGKPTIELIQRAIIAGCAQRGWACQAIRPGEIRAVLHLRKHMAEALVSFNTETFSVRYVDSAEPRYDAAENTIHRKYNQWVANLITDINGAMAIAALR
jgi:hypothetical protein